MYHILVVDDEPIICESMKIKIEACGIETIRSVAIAHSGEEGLQYLNGKGADIVFTDIKMQNMSGIDLVKAAEQCGSQAKFIILSGYDDYCYVREAFRLGAVDYLLKPVSTQEVKEKIISTICSIEEEKKQKENRQRTDNHIFENRLKEYFLDPVNHEEVLDDFRCEYLAFSVFLNNGDLRPGRIHEKIESAWMQCKETFFGTEELLIKEVWGNDNNYLLVFNYREKGIVEKIKAAICSCLEVLKEDEESAGFISVWGIITDEVTKEQASEQIEKMKELYGFRIFCSAFSLIESKEDKLDEEILSESDRRQLFELNDEERIRMLHNQIVAKFSFSVIRRYKIERIRQLYEFYIEQIREMYRNVLFMEFMCDCTFEQFHSFGQMRNYLMENLYNLRKDCQNFWKRQRTVGEIAKEYVKQNFSKEIDMSVIANMDSMNYSYFSEVFKKETGTTFREYIMKIRLEEAKRLLRDPTIKVAEISDRIGYDSSKNFSRAFHKYTGLSPRDYRKRYMNGEI